MQNLRLKSEEEKKQVRSNAFEYWSWSIFNSCMIATYISLISRYKMEFTEKFKVYDLRPLSFCKVFVVIDGGPGRKLACKTDQTTIH